MVQAIVLSAPELQSSMLGYLQLPYRGLHLNETNDLFEGLTNV